MIELVGEIGINANGDLNIAKKLIDICSIAGINYVKFQKRTIELVYDSEELLKPRQSPWGTTNFEQKQGLEFSYNDYLEIDKYCKSKGNIEWFASPWDIKSASLISMLGSKFIKIASPMLTDLEFVEFCASQYNLPLILSTGMSTIEMLDEAIGVAGRNKIYSIMHCTSTYPTDEREINLKVIPYLIQRYPRIKIGFSNHFPGIPFMIGAAALGAELIEFHITIDRSMYGSDQISSIEPHAILKLTKYIRGIERGLGDGIKRIYESELPIIEKLRR